MADDLTLWEQLLCGLFAILFIGAKFWLIDRLTGGWFGQMMMLHEDWWAILLRRDRHG